MTEPAAGPAPSISCVIPLKTRVAIDPDHDLARYLGWLSEQVEVIVADGSEPEAFAANARSWPSGVRHVRVAARTANGKVAGVCDGVAAASGELVLVADDDIRFDESSLRDLVRLMERFDAVVPQNYFEPAPWHARWDTGRSLLNRALGSDFAGTIGFRRAAFTATRGYCGAILFENLELIRTMRAAGFQVHNADDVFVRRRPPETVHFLGQRSRQAYDSCAQPLRWLVELAVLPTALAAVRSRRPLPVLAAGVAGVVVAAEVGRRRDGGTKVWPATSALWAPLWLAERGLMSWRAAGLRLSGGARYAGSRLAVAAHSTRELAENPSRCPRQPCDCDTPFRPKGRR